MGGSGRHTGDLQSRALADDEAQIVERDGETVVYDPNDESSGPTTTDAIEPQVTNGTELRAITETGTSIHDVADPNGTLTVHVGTVERVSGVDLRRRNLRRRRESNGGIENGHHGGNYRCRVVRVRRRDCDRTLDRTDVPYLESTPGRRLASSVDFFL